MSAVALGAVARGLVNTSASGCGNLSMPVVRSAVISCESGTCRSVCDFVEPNTSPSEVSASERRTSARRRSRSRSRPLIATASPHRNPVCARNRVNVEYSRRRRRSAPRSAGPGTSPRAALGVAGARPDRGSTR